MNKLQVILTIILISFVSSIALQAQSGKKIKIEYAGKLTIDEVNYPGAKILTRDETQQVHIEHKGSNMWCDKAIHYSKNNFIEAYGNVILKQGDTISMTSKYIEYNGVTEFAFASGNVVMKDPNSTITSDTLYMDRNIQQAFYKSGGTVVKDTSVTITSKIGRFYMDRDMFKFVDDVVMVNDESTIKTNYFDYYKDKGHAYLFGPSTITTKESQTYCEKGFYDTENEIGYALKKARIDYDNRTIVGDSLFFDNNKNFASASNNITVTDSINKSIIKGHYAEVYKAKDSVFVTKRALAITVQEKDSIYIHADKIMITGKPDNRNVKAYYNAKIFKSDLSGKSDSIHSNQKTGLTKLINISNLASNDKFSVNRKPIMWNVESQMTGDTIHLLANNEKEKIDSLLVFENAFVISKDTLSENNFNQINGKQLIGLFDDENQLKQIDITKNAQSIFYARNDKQELIGIDKSKSGSITILFNNGDIDEYTRYNQIDGIFYPESKFPKKERLLKGFDWREEERPKSVEDLFKDDPPFELPIIQGLEDYVPQEDFFDEEIKSKVNSSKSIYKTKTNEKNNLLIYNNEFANSKWGKSKIKIIDKATPSPNQNTRADNIVGIGPKDNGYIVQNSSLKNGEFKFSIWLKGKGEVSIQLQEAGNNYTTYKYQTIILKENWFNYEISVKKEDDGNKIRCVLGNIGKKDNLFAWGAQLIKSND